MLQSRVTPKSMIHHPAKSITLCQGHRACVIARLGGEISGLAQ